MLIHVGSCSLQTFFNMCSSLSKICLKNQSTFRPHINVCFNNVEFVHTYSVQKRSPKVRNALMHVVPSVSKESLQKIKNPCACNLLLNCAFYLEIPTFLEFFNTDFDSFEQTFFSSLFVTKYAHEMLVHDRKRKTPKVLTHID